MKGMKTFITLLTLVASFQAFGADAPKPPVVAPAVVPACKPIEAACRKEGFKEGAWKEGLGIYVHCVNAVMQGVKKPKGAKKNLPKVSAAEVAKCKAAAPSWGGGQVGS
jgi:hypothetical protein